MLLCLTGCQQTRIAASRTPQATLESNSAQAANLASEASEQFKSGNFARSRQTVSEALKLAPANGHLHLLAAKLRIEGGQLQIAGQELKLARAFGCSNGEVYYLSGVVGQRLQQPEVAYQFYQQAAEESPAEPAYLLAESEMLVAMKRMPEAIDLLQTNVDSFEQNAAIRDTLGQMLMQTGKYPQAVAMFRQASALCESDQGIHQRLALALYATGDYRQCATNVAGLIANKPYADRADLFVLLGECQLHLEDPRTALATFETATRLDGFSARAWEGRGQSELETGNLSNAEVFLSHSIWLDSSNSNSRLLLGYVRVCQSRFADALASFQKASEADARDTVSVCMIGYAMERLGRRDEAATYYKRALEMKPGDEMASKLMASVDLSDFGN